MGLLKIYPELTESTTNMTSTTDAELIRNDPFCHQLSPEIVKDIMQCGRVQSFRKGEVIFRQDEMNGHIYFLLQGRISISASRQSGEGTIIDLFTSGSLCLMNSAFLNLPSMVTAEAMSDVRVIAIAVSDFNAMISRHPVLAQIALQQMTKQGRMLLNQVRQLKLQSANERLAHYILSRLGRHEGQVITELEDERRVIAQRLGMTPESLSRSIAALRSIGVSFEQRTVRVADAAALRNYCGLDAME